MTSTQADPIYTISSNAVFETFDDEVLVINMVSGSYFAMDEIALGVWTLLQERNSLSQIIGTTEQRYEGDPTAIAEAIKSLVGELEQEGLIVRAEEGTAVPPSVASASSGDAATRPKFQKPVISKFTDMQELLLLDPIHEVDEQGWPHAKAAPVAETPSDPAS